MKTLGDSLDNALASFSVRSHIPGFAVSVVNSGAVVYQRGFGYADLQNGLPFTPCTVNFIASISKTFVGLSIMQLVQDGILDLDEPINDILPYKIVNPFFPSVDITVRHLVTHTSTLEGIFNTRSVGESELFFLEDIKYKIDDLPKYCIEILSDFKQGTRQFTLDEYIRRYTQPADKWYSEQNFQACSPGTKYLYSNLGPAIAARIIEIKSGMDYRLFSRKTIFEPLELRNTAWDYQDVHTPLVSRIYVDGGQDYPGKTFEHPRYTLPGYPSSGLKTNVEDMNRYLMEMIRGFEGRGILLKKEHYQMLFSPGLSEEFFEERDPSALNDKFDSGVLWAVSARGIRLHFGGAAGVTSFLWFDPGTSTGAFGFCNIQHFSFIQVRNIVFDHLQQMVAPCNNLENKMSLKY